METICFNFLPTTFGFIADTSINSLEIAFMSRDRMYLPPTQNNSLLEFNYVTSLSREMTVRVLFKREVLGRIFYLFSLRCYNIYDEATNNVYQ
jgi:hypothetical protein